MARMIAQIGMSTGLLAHALTQLAAGEGATKLSNVKVSA